jgi:predicted signal transduction protein with EAL and GGDEF domain
MGHLKKLYLMPPFLEGIAGAFDLFGTGGISMKTIRRLNAERIKRNTILSDLSTVSVDMKKAINQYAREIKSDR